MANEINLADLLAALRSSDDQAVIEAIRQISRLKAREAVPQLVELLEHESVHVRVAAYVALRRIDPQAADRPDLSDNVTRAGQSSGISLLEAAKLLEQEIALQHAADDDDSTFGEEAEFAAKEEADEVGWADWVDDEVEAAPPEGEQEKADRKREPSGPPQPPPAPAAIPEPAPYPQAEPGRYPPRQQAAPSRTGEVQFSAYYLREARPDEWVPLKAYVFQQVAADAVEEDAEKQLGPLDRFRRIVEDARHALREGDTITATPHLPGFQFNPPALSVGFFEDWHRFDFKMRPKDTPLNLAANGLLTFTVNGLIVADIPLSVFVTETPSHDAPQGTGAQPVYDTVFASYSHRDTQIVQKVEAAVTSLGFSYLRDVITLRSGENWSDGLVAMIEQATIFQMFWSLPYSQSVHCRQEWEYAVSLNREASHFIRPVYWLQPMPDPPPRLQHLHFTYQPDLVK